MTRLQKEQAMREIVRDLGMKCPNGTMTLNVPVALCEGDTHTEVEIDHDGRLCITGWSGPEGIGDYAEKYKDEEIDKLYTAMLGMAA